MQADLEIRHPSSTTTFQPGSLSKEITAKSLKEMNMRRSYTGFSRATSEQLGIKMMPKAYMSTRRYPREGEASLGQLETHRDTKERIGGHGHRRGKLSTLNWSEEETKKSKNKKGSSIKQNSQDILKRGHIISPWEQLGTHNLVAGNPQRLIMKNAEEYWWKSGYLEGLKKKLGEDTEKSAFSSDIGIKQTPGVNDLHLFAGKDTGGTVRKAEVLGDQAGYQGNNRMPESKTSPKASNTGVGQDRSRGQTRTVGNYQVNDQIGKTRTELDSPRNEENANKDHTGISQGTNTGQLRTSEDRNIGHTMKVYGPMGTEREPLRTTKAASQWRASVGTIGIGNGGKLSETNMNEWRALLGTITGETRSTDAQSGNSGGQTGESGAVQEENAEISKFSPGKEGVKLPLSKLSSCTFKCPCL